MSFLPFNISYLIFKLSVTQIDKIDSKAINVDTNIPTKG